MSFPCCCGEEHEWPAGVEAYIASILGEKGELCRVANRWGCWMVPRVYIAAHGLKSWELPSLAEKYGWPQAERDLH